MGLNRFVRGNILISNRKTTNLPKCSKIFLFYFLMIYSVVFTSCKKDNSLPETKNIAYTLDGRTVKLGDPLPIAIDINTDGKVDYTIFVELTANSSGDHLYAGINPIDINLIKSGPADDNRYLNMGFLISESPNATISEGLQSNERWTADFGTLVIRHTNSDSSVWYEGAWKDNTPNIVGIQHVKDGKKYFGWLRIKFDKSTEVVTLIDYAYEKTESVSIKAGNL